MSKKNRQILEGSSLFLFRKLNTHSLLNSAVCLPVPPDPPVLELKEVKGNTVTIAWTPAAFEGDSPITSFYLESKTTNGDMPAKLVIVLKYSVIVITCMFFSHQNPQKPLGTTPRWWSISAPMRPRPL